MLSAVSAKIRKVGRGRNWKFCDSTLSLQKENVLIMRLMRRKIDDFLKEWKEDENRLPLIVKGALQIGKTASIMQ